MPPSACPTAEAAFRKRVRPPGEPSAGEPSTAGEPDAASGVTVPSLSVRARFLVPRALLAGVTTLTLTSVSCKVQGGGSAG